MEIVITMCKLMLAMLIGFYLYKKGVIDANASAAMSALIVKVTCPALLLYSISTVENGDKALVLKIFLLGIVSYVFFVAIGMAFPRLFKVRKQLWGTYACMLIFANTGFMGYPVAQSLYGDSAIFYVAIFNMPFNFLFFSLGMYLLEKDGHYGEDMSGTAGVNFKALINPGLVSSLLAILIYFCDIKLPSMVFSCAGFIGNITTPLSMIVIGCTVARASFGEIKSEKLLIPVLICRLMILPLITRFALILAGLDGTMASICAISIAMPVGSLVAMGSAQYPEQGKAAGIAVAVSTILSMVTIPVIAMIMG